MLIFNLLMDCLYVQDFLFTNVNLRSQTGHPTVFLMQLFIAVDCCSARLSSFHRTESDANIGRSAPFSLQGLLNSYWEEKSSARNFQ